MEIMMNDKSLQALLCLLLVITLPSCVAKVDETRPSVTFALSSDLLYVGEYPTVQVQVTAPPSGTVRVVKSDRSWWASRFLWSVASPVGGSDGGPGGCIVARQDEDDDFLELTPGQTRAMEFGISYWAKKPARYIISLEFAPTPDRSYVVRDELVLTYRNIPPDDVVRRVRLPVARSPNYPNMADPGSVEFLNVRTDRGQVLLFHRLNEDGTTFRLDRVHGLDHDSDLAVVPDYSEGKIDPTWWVRFKLGGKQHLIQLNHALGKILRKTVVDDTDPEPPLPKAQEEPVIDR
jgi:hypothetical protein